jgi:hypothetical protein
LIPLDQFVNLIYHTHSEILSVEDRTPDNGGNASYPVCCLWRNFHSWPHER